MSTPTTHTSPPHTQVRHTQPNITDTHGRRFQSLRVSLTSACNFACRYCVPDHRLQRAPDELTHEMFCRAIDLLHVELGLQKIRITGGEPLLAHSFVPVLRHVSGLPVEASITTNAALLHRHRDALTASSVRRVNVSLDSLDSARFRALAQGGDLHSVLDNIEWLLQEGFKIKINMVPMRGYNEEDIVPMLDYCLTRGIELRYIELMRMGHAYEKAFFTKHFISTSEMLQRIKAFIDFTPLARLPHSTSVGYTTPKGEFAFIANESTPFCGDCDRLRLTSNGTLFGCISNQRNESMRDLLTMPYEQAAALLRKRLYNALAHKQTTFHGQWTTMKVLGG